MRGATVVGVDLKNNSTLGCQDDLYITERGRGVVFRNLFDVFIEETSSNHGTTTTISCHQVTSKASAPLHSQPYSKIRILEDGRQWNVLSW